MACICVSVPHLCMTSKLHVLRGLDSKLQSVLKPVDRVPCKRLESSCMFVCTEERTGYCCRFMAHTLRLQEAWAALARFSASWSSCGLPCACSLASSSSNPSACVRQV